MPLRPLALSAHHRNSSAWSLRLPVMVASLDERYSTSVDSTTACSRLVITTPQGTGHPRNLWPETLTLPMPGFLNVTLGACGRNEKPKEIKKMHGFSWLVR